MLLLSALRSCRPIVQVLALEKLLLVTSTVPATAAPPPRPPLASLAPVNENLPPAQPPRGAAGVARVPDSPVEGPASPGAGAAAADGGAAMGNGQVVARGAEVGLGSGFAGAAFAMIEQASGHSPEVRRASCSPMYDLSACRQGCNVCLSDVSAIAGQPLPLFGSPSARYLD